MLLYALVPSIAEGTRNQLYTVQLFAQHSGQEKRVVRVSVPLFLMEQFLTREGFAVQTSSWFELLVYLTIGYSVRT